MENEYMATMNELMSKYKISLRNKVLNFFSGVRNDFLTVVYDIKSIIHWLPIIKKIRPYECFDGILLTTAQHLRDFIFQKKHYSIVEPNANAEDIRIARRALVLIQKLREDDYLIDETDKVEERYPTFLFKISKDKRGTSMSGRFLKYKNGYVGIDSGLNPKQGYFVLKNGRFELADAPNEDEVKAILQKIKEYDKEMKSARQTARFKKESDIDELLEILRNNFFDWWD